MSSPPKPLEQNQPAPMNPKTMPRRIRFDAPHRVPQPILAALRGKADEPPR